MHRKTRLAISAKNSRLVLIRCPRVQHAPARFSTMPADLGHMVPIPTDYLAALSASEPRLA
jgi:hypothetical protein